MCNEFAQERAWKAYCDEMQREALTIITPEQPNLPFGSVRPSDNAAIVRAVPGGAALELMPWGWTPGSGKGLIINVRAEGRCDPAVARGLALIDRFYEFKGDKPPKSKFEFSPATNEPVAFGVIIRNGRFTLATCEPGDDVRDIHDRQPIIIPATRWKRWLTEDDWPADLARPSPPGTLKSLQVR